MQHNKVNNSSNLTSTLENAAMEAAMADGLISSSSQYGYEEKVKKSGLRRGKWTAEEEFYANRLIYEFKLGLLPLTDGTTLRTFLSKLLNCDPMRISKKFVGQNCIGKQVFRRRQQDLEKLTAEQIDASRRELAELERKFLERVAQSNRSKSSSTGKDIRSNYEDESGNKIMPPWMVPPSMLDTTAIGAHISGNSNKTSKPQQITSSQFQAHDNVQSISAKYIQHPQDFNSAFSTFDSHLGGFNNGGFPNPNANLPYDYNDNKVRQNEEINTLHRVTSLELLNAIAQFNSPIGSQENLAGLGNNSSTASALKSQQLQHQRRMMGASEIVQDPTPDVFPGLAVRNNSSTLTFGDSMGWPSFSNLHSLSGVGGSMDDLLAAGLSHSGAGSTDALGLSVNYDNKSFPKASSLSVEDGVVGYPLEEPATGSAEGESRGKLFATHHSGAVGTTTTENASQQALEQTVGGGTELAQIRVKAPIVDMGSMGQTHHHAFVPHDNQSTIHGAGVQPVRASSAPIVSSSQSARVQAARSNSTVPGMPKNGSIEDFWMLVNMGDLPQPEQDVLSQTVWSPHERSKAATQANTTSGASIGSAVSPVSHKRSIAEIYSSDPTKSITGSVLAEPSLNEVRSSEREDNILTECAENSRNKPIAHPPLKNCLSENDKNSRHIV